VCDAANPSERESARLVAHHNCLREKDNRSFAKEAIDRARRHARVVVPHALEGKMAREIQIMTVGLVFLFLGAFVFGAF
jgi:hypothetical protein